ncbi:hypothetical protein [Streptomyces sp. NPDC059994]|uniref:hypothetical protein n=1 Tax=Streptomyces sp. NPDC059994 TaxID=3347029 RepID=UPI0036BC1ACE
MRTEGAGTVEADGTDAGADAGAVWLESLARRFPDLLAELAPSPTGLRERPGGGAARSTTAPIRLHISDAVRDITDGVVELEEAVRERLGLRPAAPAPVVARLRRIAGLLDRVRELPDLAEHLTQETRRMARRCARELGDPEQMIRLDGRCPACDSVSLRIFPERGAVLCVNPVCRHVVETASGDSAQGESTQGGSAQGGSAQGDSAQGDSAQGDSAQGGSPQGDSAQGEAS